MLTNASGVENVEVSWKPKILKAKQIVFRGGPKSKGPSYEQKGFNMKPSFFSTARSYSFALDFSLIILFFLFQLEYNLPSWVNKQICATQFTIILLCKMIQYDE